MALLKKEEKKNIVLLSAPRTREQAYVQVSEIADYLENVEPHSPTPFLLRKAITWGSMNLQDLLKEFSESGLELSQIQQWIGIKTGKKNES